MATELSQIARKPIVSIALVVVVFLGLYVYTTRAYNEMVRLDEGVQNAWGQVENQYQRRSDLIPNFVNIVKGYATYEQATRSAS